MTTRRDQETASVFALLVQCAWQLGSMDVAKVAAAIESMRSIELDIRGSDGVSYKREVRAELRAFVEQCNRPEFLAAARALLTRFAVQSDELVVSDDLPPTPPLRPPLRGPWS